MTNDHDRFEISLEQPKQVKTDQGEFADHEAMDQTTL
jgi:hypothetical protein